MFKKKLSSILGAAAITISAIGAAAFTTPKEPVKEDLVVFEYVAPDADPYTQVNVQNKANWKYSTNVDRCEKGDALPCKIYVSKAHIVQADSVITLNEAFVITASEGTSSHVTATSDGATPDFISNKSM